MGCREVKTIKPFPKILVPQVHLSCQTPCYLMSARPIYSLALKQVTFRRFSSLLRCGIQKDRIIEDIKQSTLSAGVVGTTPDLVVRPSDVADETDTDALTTLCCSVLTAAKANNPQLLLPSSQCHSDVCV